MDDISFTPILAECASDDSFDPWKIAIARFLESLDEKSRGNFNKATPENLFYCASKVEREDREAIKARSAIRRIHPLISAVKDYGKALDVYANLASPYLAPIWGSIRVVLVIASSHAKFYSRILDVFSRIGDILPRFRMSHCLTWYLSIRNVLIYCRGLSENIQRQKAPTFYTVYVQGLS